MTEVSKQRCGQDVQNTNRRTSDSVLSSIAALREIADERERERQSLQERRIAQERERERQRQRVEREQRQRQEEQRSQQAQQWLEVERLRLESLREQRLRIEAEAVQRDSDTVHARALAEAERAELERLRYEGHRRRPRAWVPRITAILAAIGCGVVLWFAADMNRTTRAEVRALKAHIGALGDQVDAADATSRTLRGDLEALRESEHAAQSTGRAATTRAAKKVVRRSRPRRAAHKPSGTRKPPAKPNRIVKHDDCPASQPLCANSHLP